MEQYRRLQGIEIQVAELIARCHLIPIQVTMCQVCAPGARRVVARQAEARLAAQAQAAHLQETPILTGHFGSFFRH